MAVVSKPGMDIHIGEEHYQMLCQLRRSFQGYTGYAVLFNCCWPTSSLF